MYLGNLKQRQCLARRSYRWGVAWRVHVEILIAIVRSKLKMEDARVCVNRQIATHKGRLARALLDVCQLCHAL